MRLLIDTHLLLWAANDTLPKEAVPYFIKSDNELFFSSASIWEIAIKRSLNRPDFQVNPNDLYCGLVNNGYSELMITCYHSLLVSHLPPYHKDPFDRILIAQAMAENLTLISSDKAVSQYSPAVYVCSAE
ncbi:MAG: type II toxin-antitoxin system VapC family toxin [Treponema sp.]|nr:type II toxin-antitoxin system VapC family toxin [Treponema sp.]